MTKFIVAMIVGSTRSGSLNQKLANAIIKLAPDTLSFRQIRIDDLPFYNGDLEGARPEAINRMTTEVSAADAVFFVMPEYNRSVPAMLKNAIDWGSKPIGHNVWAKPTAITGTSPGAIGTAMGQQHLRQIMAVIGATVMGGEAYISFKTPDLIQDDGSISDDTTRDFIRDYVNKFATLVEKLAG